MLPTQCQYTFFRIAFVRKKLFSDRYFPKIYCPVKQTPKWMLPDKYNLNRFKTILHMHIICNSYLLLYEQNLLQYSSSLSSSWVL